MEEKSPKISFIPKGSLVREESFLERPKSRNFIGVLGVSAALIVVAGFGGLYFFNSYLETQIIAKLDQVKSAQGAFKDSAQVEKANSFYFRAGLVQEILASHASVSAILNFLASNTLESVMYSELSFTKDDSGANTVKLIGEAPNYSSLGYQKEIFSGKKDELLSSRVADVALTPFGTVSFKLYLAFRPDYISYIKNTNTVITTPPSNISTGTTEKAATSSATAEEHAGALSLPPLITGASTETETHSATSSSIATSSTPQETSDAVSSTTEATKDMSAVPVSVATQQKSFWDNFISWFKFW